MLSRHSAFSWSHQSFPRKHSLKYTGSESVKLIFGRLLTKTEVDKQRAELRFIFIYGAGLQWHVKL